MGFEVIIRLKVIAYDKSQNYEEKVEIIRDRNDSWHKKLKKSIFKRVVIIMKMS